MSGSDDGKQWVFIKLDEKMARRQGMPFQVPIPKDEFEGLADDGLGGDKLKRYIQSFLEEAPVAKDGTWRRRNSTLISQLEGFIDKGPLWEKAQKLFAQNEYDKAIKTLRRITIMMPEDHAAKMNYASALANVSQYDKAYKALRQIRDTFSGEPDYHVTVAQIHIARDNAEAAVDELLRGLEGQPDHRPSMDALAKLGVLSKIYEDPKDASTLVYVRTDAMKDYLLGRWDEGERDVNFYLEQLNYHEKEHRYELALEAATRAIAAAGDAGCERAELGRIAALRQLGKKDEALAAAQAYVAQAPQSAGAYVELSTCLDQLGKADDAKAAIDKALACDPGDLMALALKFWPDDRGDMMEVQAALPALQKYAEEHPDVTGAQRSLARAMLVVGADEQALSLFEKAVTQAPEDDDLRSEWWAELANKTMYQQIITDSEKLGNMAERDWRLRWNEAEAYRGLKRLMQARACYMQLNADEALHVDIRKRAKRAAMEMGSGEPTAAS